jgi:hypothetical protein
MTDSRISSQISHLPGQILFDLARNDAASREYRKAAVELLYDRQYRQADHPELALMLAELKAERSAKSEVESIVESAIEDTLPNLPPAEKNPVSIGAPSASFTTKNILGDDVIQN